MTRVLMRSLTAVSIFAAIIGYQLHENKAFRNTIAVQTQQINFLSDQLSKQDSLVQKLLEVSKILDASDRSNSLTINSLSKKLEAIEPSALIKENSIPKSHEQISNELTEHQLHQILQKLDELEENQHQVDQDRALDRVLSDHDKLLKDFRDRQ